MKQGRVLAITNKKGGVGKTTTSEQIADIASNSEYGHGLDVLGISIDPQGNWDNSLRIKQGTPGIYDFIVNGIDTRVNVSEHLDFITCTGATAIKAGLEKSGEPFSELCFSRNLSSIIHEYDLVVIDCPPDESYLNNCVYTAADGLVVPITTDRYSIEGIVELSKFVSTIRQLNPKLDFEGILITKVKRNTLVEKSAFEDATECARILNTKVFQSTISLSTVAEQAQRAYQPLMQFNPKANVTIEYKMFVDELLNYENRT